MELGELGGVALLGVLEVVHGALAEEEAEHARDVPTANVVTRFPRGIEDTVDQASRDPAFDRMVGDQQFLILIERGKRPEAAERAVVDIFVTCEF